MAETNENILPSPSNIQPQVVTRNRPAGWSRKSCAPYYKEIYGKQIKREVDKMITSDNPIIWRFSVWCNGDTSMTENTLYTRINQSIRYLLEMMDDDGKYKKWYQSVRISRERKLGVTIRFIPGFSGSGEDFTSEEIEPRETMPKWKLDMELWLEGDNSTPFCKENLALSPEEIVELKVQFSQLSNVQFSITEKSIKIIRV